MVLLQWNYPGVKNVIWFSHFANAISSIYPKANTIIKPSGTMLGFLSYFYPHFAEYYGATMKVYDIAQFGIPFRNHYGLLFNIERFVEAILSAI